MVMVVFLGAELSLSAQTSPPFTWEGPVVTKTLFTQDLGMLDSEREEYATNLSILATNQIVKAKGSPQSLVDARRLLGLALHLSPRNKRALVTNYQLTKGMLPEVIEGNYSPQVFARLLLSRGQLLEKQGGDENKRLARYFIHLAANLDPKNEDAVYICEIQRLDRGEVDWSTVTDAPQVPVEKKP